MTRDIIIIVGGGTMNGLFGAGVLTALEKADIYDRIHSVYGISAGAHNGAYFLAQDTGNQAALYYEDLIDERFIKKNKIGTFIKELGGYLFNKEKELTKIVDIDYLIEIETTKRKLDIEKIKASPINFYVKVFDLGESREKYIDAKKDPLKAIQASAAVIPFYPCTVKIDGNEYVDGSILSSPTIPDREILKITRDNPNKKIVCVFNQPVKFSIRARNFFGNFLWAVFLGMYLERKYFFRKLRQPLKYFLTKKFLKNKNVCGIESEIDLPVFFQKPERLKELYEHGIKKGEDFLKKLA